MQKSRQLQLLGSCLPLCFTNGEVKVWGLVPKSRLFGWYPFYAGNNLNVPYVGQPEYLQVLQSNNFHIVGTSEVSLGADLSSVYMGPVAASSLALTHYYGPVVLFGNNGVVQHVENVFDTQIAYPSQKTNNILSVSTGRIACETRKNPPPAAKIWAAFETECVQMNGLTTCTFGCNTNQAQQAFCGQGQGGNSQPNAAFSRPDVELLAVGMTSICFVTMGNGTLSCCSYLQVGGVLSTYGYPGLGQCTGTNLFFNYPYSVVPFTTPYLENLTITDIAMGAGHLCVVLSPLSNTTSPTQSPTIYSPYLYSGDGTAAPFSSEQQTNATSLADSIKGSMVACAGNNEAGQLGLGNTKPVYFFNIGQQVIQFDLSIKAITAGSFHTCVTMIDDTLRCWGLNSAGQLGIENNNSIVSALPLHNRY